MLRYRGAVADTPGVAGSTPSAAPRIGILGGTFDPPHIGHLVMATAVREELGLDEVVLMVAGDPYQKTEQDRVTPAEDRLAMTAAAVEGLSGLEASDMEIRRKGPTYTVETLESMRRERPGVELFWILGADAARGLDTWHRYRDLASLATIVVVDRPGANPGTPPGVPVRFVEAPRLDVSSTELRARAAAGRSLQFLVPEGAISVIRQRGLYDLTR